MSATVVSAPAYAGAPGAGWPGRLRRLWRGPSRDPAWARPALLALLAVTGLLYLFNLSRNGYANDFYAAAVQAGTKSWKAFFFGSFDASSFITVDKTPASLWVDEISGRIFGFSSWSLLVPQALEGIASVWLLFAAVRRWFGPAAGLAAGLACALTPAAALIFRFNNPDALLVLLMTAAGYCVQRAVERPAPGRQGAALRWLAFAGLLLGFAFLAKMLQAFLVLPGFALAYLIAGPVRLPHRIWHVLVAGFAMIVGAGWWVAVAELWPAGSRPYFGGSTNNNILQLALGYNGLGRIDGTETGSIGFNGSSVGGRGGGASFGGSTGIFRLFQSEFGGQVSWLLPAALISLAGLVWVARPRRRLRTALAGPAQDTPAAVVSPSGGPLPRMRAFAAIWGGWLLVTGLVFSFMQGIIHPYYMVALAPAIGALVGVGATALWQARVGWAGRAAAALAVAVTAWWSYVLLDRTPSWLPWLRWLVLAAGAVAVLALLAAALLAHRAARPASRETDATAGRGLSARGLAGLAATATGAALVAGLAGPLAYTLDTVNSTSTGSIPSAGPAVTGSFGSGFARGAGGTFGGGAGRGGGTGGGAGGFGGGFPGGGNGTGAGNGTGTGTGTGGNGGFPRRFGGAGGGRAGAAGGGGAGGPGGGLSGSTNVSSALVKLLEAGASRYKWIAATEGSQEAAPIELATGGLAVVAIGGFNGSDPAPTLSQFEAMVAKGEIHYYVGRGANSFGGGSGSNAIASWVAAHYTAQTVGGSTVYDLTQPKS